ncbi:sterol-binding protein [Rhodospirillum rubrum F11]|uniref:Sterol-binding n=1 Tax=Rhodospirillum rubrum (strain ATCC 11170 / ATH 1.1.1 / DSM 467 / LMG 4362 / NCIMB 8255 / S1) TaxID=269796 RepID=Q2RUS9_RHORT|nr:SCP2 sterol-binding domain-containing protein [Rhodospirillum rubrum]ABC22116.1 Sterol-binding [Rhodospirillum rubrum ATCC 11170]AEO47830.1 sterol-binding protein [Rhodospirillum rubrum F11]MBK5953705.1 sterol-binding protein [Rhodospirillum rubrum]QXG81766.1 SCP2 sterol-binding domain-containing protein [Rhodospirillum rubrum]
MRDGEMTDRLTADIDRLDRLGAVVRFDLGADGQLIVDARTAPARLGDDDLDADCTISLSANNLGKLLAGTLDPMLAFAMGRIRVSGSKGVAMKLVAALE